MKINKHSIWNERWRLAALTTEELIKIGLVAIFTGVLFVLYHFQGNTTDVKMFSESAFTWLYIRWHETDGDFSHGALIPLISLFVIYLNRFKIAAAPKYVSTLGLMVVIAGLLIHWMGTKSQHPRASLGALMIILWGIPFYFYGWHVAKHLMFAAAYMIFAIPLNFLDAISFKLKMF
ncbi:MAG: archaeosortase/exosortase family protein, partial [Verrucomicrobiota bacterium]